MNEYLLPTSINHTQNIQPPPAWNHAQKTAGIVLLAGGGLALIAGALATIAFAHGPFAQLLNLKLLNGTLLGRNVICGSFLTSAFLIGVGGTMLYTARREQPKPGYPLTPEHTSLPILNPELYKSPFSFDFWYLGEECDQAFNEVYLKVLYPEDRSPINVAPLIKKLDELRREMNEKYTRNIENLRWSEIKDKYNHAKTLEECLAAICQRIQTKINLLNKLPVDFDELTIELPKIGNFETLHLNALTEIEEAIGIRDNLRKLLSDIFNGIMCKDPNWIKLNESATKSPLVTPEALAHGLRLCRKFFCDRDLQFHYNSGETKGGMYQDVFQLLKPFAELGKDLHISDFAYGSTHIDEGYLTHIHGFYYVDENPKPHWVQTCFEKRGGHVLIQVYSYYTSQPHFIELDNLNPQPKVTSLKIMQRAHTSGTCGTLEILVRDPQNFVMPALSPKPETWILPAWEDQNCFFAVALVALALNRFYAAQNPPRIEN